MKQLTIDQPDVGDMISLQPYHLIEAANGLIVDCQERAEEGVSLSKRLKNAENAIEKRRTSYTVPLNNILRAINGAAKSVMDPVKKARTTLNKKVLIFQAQEKVRIAEANRKAEEEERRLRAEQLYAAKAGKVAITAPAIVDRVPELEKFDGSYTRTDWKWELQDIDQVPRPYLELKASSVTEFMRSEVKAGREPKLPGIIFKKEESLIT